MNVYLYGASGHGKVIKEILEANGVNVEAFVDDNLNINKCSGIPVVHDAIDLSPMIVSIGVNNIRKIVVERLQAINKDIKFLSAIHPSAIISPSAKIGEGTVVMAGAIINADAVIGKHCIINTGASIDHECVVGDFAHIAPHSTLCGQVQVGEGSMMGVGSCAIPCVKIGNWSTIGAGSTAISNIPDRVIAVGVPAKEIHTKDMKYKKTKHIAPNFVGGG